MRVQTWVEFEFDATMENVYLAPGSNGTVGQ